MASSYSGEMNLSTVSSTSVSWRELVKMLKPVVALLVIVTAVPSMILAGNAFPKFSVFLAVSVGIFFTSAAGSIINQVIDFDIDSRMARTSDRLIPTLRLNRNGALLLGITFMAIGCWVLFQFASPLASATALAGDLFYIFVYTLLLKRRTPHNIVIGGAAGAVGPLIGWAAVTNGFSLEAWLMFLLIFLWTPPHFWALAIKYRDDYAKAKVPMLPVARGEAVTKWQMLIYSTLMVPNVALLFWLTDSHWLTQLVMNLITLRFVWLCYSLWRTEGQDPMPVFQYSCIYLFAVFFGLAIDQFVLLVM